jgi:hypothetical protein
VTDSTFSDFQRDLLQAVSVGGSRFGVATDCIDEELLESSPGREAVEDALRGFTLVGARIGRARYTGLRVHFDLVHVLTGRDGKCTRLDIYLSESEALKAVGLPE